MENLIRFCENVTFLKKLINTSEGGGWAPKKAMLDQPATRACSLISPEPIYPFHWWGFFPKHFLIFLLLYLF